LNSDGTSAVSVYIIAFNEAEKIRAAVESVRWADEVVVADSRSVDGTAEIAESLGARVVQIPFRGFGDLRNRAMDACRHRWIFSLDADERCTPEARDEIRQVLRNDGPEDAYYVPRKNFFMGRWIRRSGFYPDYRQPQLFRKGTLSFEDDPVHEAYAVHSERIGYFAAPIVQIPFRDFEEMVRKANRYSTLGAEKLARQGRTAGMGTALGHAIWAFFAHYLLKLGFLDGWAGLAIALGNFEGTFYKYAKLHERHAAWALPEEESGEGSEGRGSRGGNAA